MIGAFLMGIQNYNMPEQVQENVNDIPDEIKTFYEECESIPCKDDIDFAIPRITMENNENFFKLAAEITTDEIQHYIATNEEVIYEGEKLKSIFDKVVDFIREAWRKIQGIFDKAIELFDRFAINDSKFIKKYKDKLKDYNGYIIINGYAFPHDRIYTTEPYAILKANVPKPHGVFSDTYSGMDVDDKLREIRAFIIDKSTNFEINTEQFNVELKKYFYGSEKPDSLTYNEKRIKTLLDEIESCKKIKKAIRDAYSETKKYFQELENTAKTMKSNMSKASNDESKEMKDIKDSLSKRASNCIKLVQGAIGISNIVVKAHIGALNASHKQGRAVLSKLYSEIKKDARVKNSSSSEEEFEDFEDFFEDENDI